MEGEYFYNDKIECVFGEYFKEFAEKNTMLFSSGEMSKKLDELMEDKTIHREFTRFLVRKICLIVFSMEESVKLKEKFEGKMN